MVPQDAPHTGHQKLGRVSCCVETSGQGCQRIGVAGHCHCATAIRGQSVSGSAITTCRRFDCVFGDGVRIAKYFFLGVARKKARQGARVSGYDCVLSVFYETQHTPLLSVKCCRVSTVTRYRRRKNLYRQLLCLLFPAFRPSSLLGFTYSYAGFRRMRFVWFLPFLASLIFARVSGERGFPLSVSLFALCARGLMVFVVSLAGLTHLYPCFGR